MFLRPRYGRDSNADSVSPRASKNPATEDRRIEINWRVTDANGKNGVDAKNRVWTPMPTAFWCAANCFEPPARGAYLLEVSTSVKVKGPDFDLSQKLPFAVIPAPPAGFRARQRGPNRFSC